MIDLKISISNFGLNHLGLNIGSKYRTILATRQVSEVFSTLYDTHQIFSLCRHQSYRSGCHMKIYLFELKIPFSKSFYFKKALNIKFRKE